MHRSNVLKLGLLVGCLGGMVGIGKAQVPPPVSVLGIIRRATIFILRTMKMRCGIFMRRQRHRTG